MLYLRHGSVFFNGLIFIFLLAGSLERVTGVRVLKTGAA